MKGGGMPIEKVVNVVDAAAKRVLEGKNSALCQPLGKGLERQLKLVAWQRLGPWAGHKRSRLAVRARNALVRYPLLRAPLSPSLPPEVALAPSLCRSLHAWTGAFAFTPREKGGEKVCVRSFRGPVY